MISYIHGDLVYKTETSVVVDTGGVGYEISVPSGSELFLSSPGDQVKVHTVMIVKEDEMSLYGFSDRESVLLFKLLLTVSGVGAKAAMAILSAMSIREVASVITFGDATALTRANGVGKKTAERIILELSDKISKLPIAVSSGNVSGQTSDSSASGAVREAKNEAIEVLLSLGYSRTEAGSAVQNAPDEVKTAEEYIKFALQNLG
jgi:Holliday junction DNA helicase RuvA